jgi:L-iditol 2-dehydrogenase
MLGVRFLSAGKVQLVPESAVSRGASAVWLTYSWALHKGHRRSRASTCDFLTRRFSGTPPSHGTMRRFVAHPARYLHKMADTMSYELGALIEPLSVAYNAVVRAAPYLGQPVVIAGAGPIGLSMALCARAAGCHPICITDLEENRLEQARDLGFDRTLRIDTTWDRLETAERVRSVMGPGCVPSIVFECTGAASSIYSACYVCYASYTSTDC